MTLFSPSNTAKSENSAFQPVTSEGGEEYKFQVELKDNSPGKNVIQNPIPIRRYVILMTGIGIMLLIILGIIVHSK